MTTAQIDQAYDTEQFTDREPWRAARLTGITSTDAPVIVGVSPYKKLFRLYHEKRGTTPETVAETEAMFWGHVLEEPITQRFCRDTSATVTNPGQYCLQRHPETTWLISTIDRYIKEITGDESEEFRVAANIAGPGVLEIKNAGFYMAEKWHDEAPLNFQVQVQHQLAVTGLEWGAIAGLLGGNKFVWSVVRRDQVFIDKLLTLEAQFHDDVAAGREPPVDDSEDTKDLIAKLWPTETGEQIALPVEVLEAHDKLTDAKARAKTAKADVTAAGNIIKTMLGDASLGTHESGLVYSLNNQTRRAHTVKESTFRVLRCRQEPS